MINFFKNCVCVALTTLVMAQGVALTSFAAETHAVESSASVSTVASQTTSSYITLGAGQTKYMTSVFPISGKVVYRSSSASTVNVTAGGKMTVLKTGGATVTATMTDSGNVYRCYVTALTAPTSVKLNKSTVSTVAGKSFALTASVSPERTVDTVTWKSSNTSVATVSSTGVVKTLKSGYATITATTYNGLSSSCQFTVKPSPTSIELDKTTLSLENGKTYTLSKTLTPSNAYSSVEWKSDNSSIASVSSSGVVTAKGVGKTVIRVTTCNGISASCTVTVKDNSLTDADKVLKLVNEERKKAGVPVLSTNSALNKAAQKRAEEISRTFNHKRPDGSSCFTVLDDFRVDYMAAGENIAAGQKTSEAVMTAWMNSAGHKKNILNSNFKNIGIGCYVKDGCKYWVQIFIS